MIINKLFILTISFSVRYARCLNISNNLVQVMLKDIIVILKVLQKQTAL